MHALKCRCFLEDALRKLLKSPSWCEHNMADVWMPWMMLHVIGRNNLPDAYIQRRCMYSLDDATFHWLTSLPWYTHPFHLCSCKPWLKLHAIGWYRLPNAQIPRHMHVRWYHLSLVDTSRSMCAGYEWFAQTTTDAGSPQPTSTKQCREATSDVCWHLVLVACHFQTLLARCSHAIFVHKGLWWCCMLLADIPFKIRTFHVHVCRTC